MSGGSMTANHVEHGITTFPGITIKTVPLHFGRGTKCNVPGWADGETGDFKGLTLSNSGPVFLGSRGFPSGKARIATGTTITPPPAGAG